jgi:hypothetical protein
MGRTRIHPKALSLGLPEFCDRRLLAVYKLTPSARPDSFPTDVHKIPPLTSRGFLIAANTCSDSDVLDWYDRVGCEKRRVQTAADLRKVRGVEG